MKANCERLMVTKGLSPRRAEVVLYTRSGCHLCDEAKAEMATAGCPDEYELVEINIEADPDLVERYGSEIPVILINGVKAFKYRLTAEDFKRKLRRMASMQL
jgi:glutaredoxin